MSKVKVAVRLRPMNRRGEPERVRVGEEEGGEAVEATSLVAIASRLRGTVFTASQRKHSYRSLRVGAFDVLTVLQRFCLHDVFIITYITAN